MSRLPPPAAGKAYGVEGQFFICATCGKSIPISEIAGQCGGCGLKICKECGKLYPLCAECGWLICKNCAYLSKSKKYYHKQHKPTECLIVTACFSSPLAMEVKYLRTIRDQKIMNTRSGIKFIKLLNRIYYSFSPKVASHLETHLMIRRIIRSLLISPLLKSLYASETFSSLMKNTELQVMVMVIVSLINVTLGLPLWKIIPLKFQFCEKIQG